MIATIMNEELNPIRDQNVNIDPLESLNPSIKIGKFNNDLKTTIVILENISSRKIRPLVTKWILQWLQKEQGLPPKRLRLTSMTLQRPDAQDATWRPNRSEEHTF